MKEYDRMKFIDFIRPALTDGKHTVSVTQKVQQPQQADFAKEEHFYVTGRAYTLAADEVFSVSPSENECGDFSRLLPFITLSSRSLPWERKITEEIGGIPVPWLALIVLSAEETAEEYDISLGELQNSVPEKTFFPKASDLPELVLEEPEELCHVIDLPVNLYRSIAPSFADMAFLTHVKRVNLADTEDKITERDGDFSVIMANRFVPTGHGERLKSTVHLVSMLGIPADAQQEDFEKRYDKIRLVSLHRWNVYSVYDEAPTFQALIEELKENTGAIGYDRGYELLKKGYVAKKHLTRSGETTYSLYRSPLLPYKDKKLDIGFKPTADGYLIYDPQTGIFDTSYAAAFQLGRMLSLARSADAQTIRKIRKKTKYGRHKKLLQASMPKLDVKELCDHMVNEMR